MNRVAMFWAIGWMGAVLAEAQQPCALPTENDSLFRGGGPAFYQYVERDFQGVKSKPWEGGAYGMVRGPRQWGREMILTHWHEGVDIKPVRLDSAGEPLDTVRSTADGRVAYASKTPGASNYGCYVVVGHLWDGAPYYSLYAHLNRVDVAAGQRIKRGDALGLMGYTGSGITKERAHLHFEINLLLNTGFERWHKANFPKDPNKHGIYNGINLIGLDVAKYLQQQRVNPALTVPEFLRAEEPFFAVAFPATAQFELVKRYPWLAGGHAGATPGAWILYFTQGGVPMRAEPCPDPVTEPRVVFVKKAALPLDVLTKGYISNEGGKTGLTGSGMRFISLVSGNFP